ncbi:MAG TPA: glycosyltransferase family 4 protein [Chthoniobacterales bacterium]|nr:glycosyltransferase family 4 protein [Chthoniobacterales bacterium]
MDRQLGYLFERFPAFTQTFCARELSELYRQGAAPPVFSIRRPAEGQPSNIALENIKVYYLPDTNSLEFKIRTKLISPRLRGLWSGSGDIRDKGRFREAVYLGSKLRKAEVSHLHVHFAGLASRTAWWIKRLFGITYSFTGHANDIFCPKPDQRVTLGDLVREASFIVTVSDFSANWLRRDFPEAAAKVYRVYNGLDLATFRPAARGAKPVRLLSVGRIIEKKGFVFLVEACRLLRCSGFDFVCEIVGEGPERPRLEELIQAYQLSDRVRLMGSMPQTDIIDLLARSSIFVFPAIHDSCGDSDNLPTVLIEAMASNLPVIATEIAGIPEIVQQNKNGILVREKDAAQLANAIRVLACNQGLLEQYGSMSRRIAAEKFALANTVAELKSLFGRFNLIR